jgi:hypothetical protein
MSMRDKRKYVSKNHSLVQGYRTCYILPSAGERIYQCSSCVAGDDDSVVDLRDALPVFGERAGVRRGEVHDEKHWGTEITVTYLVLSSSSSCGSCGRTETLTGGELRCSLMAATTLRFRTANQCQKKQTK